MAFAHSLAPFSHTTVTVNFTVPPGIAYGTYYLHLDVDYSHIVWEPREGDNSTISGRRLLVNCG